MNDTIKGSIIGALITGVISILIFFLGNFSTQKSIVASLSARFNTVDKEMSYEQALESIYQERESNKREIDSLNAQINELNIEISDLNTEVNEKQLQIDNQQSQEEIDKIIKNATDYWNNSDYIQALTLLKNEKLKSSDIESLYEQYSQKYVSNLLAQADSLISEKKHDEAIDILKESKGIVYNDKMVEDKINDITNNQPIKLSALKVSASRFFSKNQDKPIEDTVGNRYSTGNSFITYAEGDSKYGYATFFLDQKYTSLTGNIAVSDESENRSDIQLEGWIEIGTKNNNDEFNLLWSSPTLSRATSPIEIPEIDLSNSEWLEIRYYNNGNYYSLANGNLSLRIIISDVMIYND